MLLNVTLEIDPKEVGFENDSELIKNFKGIDESNYREFFAKIGLPVTLRSESVTTSRPSVEFVDSEVVIVD